LEEATVAEYEERRRQHLAALAELMPEQIERLRWPAERLRRERRERLRDLLRVARSSSPWHAGRLAGVDPDTFTEADLPSLEPMTKDDLMANWDAVVTDRRLSLDLVERHLAGLRSDAYLLDEFHAVVSGGSTGRRGVFAFGWRPWAVGFAGFMRPILWDRAVTPELAALPNRLAMVAAGTASHMTAAMGQTFANPMAQMERFPVSRPIDEIVARLNDYQPVNMLGYPSALALLAVEARDGRLKISPLRICSTSEPLLPHVRRSVEEAFQAPVANMWGTSEAGPMGVGCYRGPGIHLCDDLVIIEPVDGDGRPVPPGTRSAKIYVTAISNPTLPLIRLEITDQITFLDQACPCGSAHQLIADIAGRMEDSFSYPGDVIVHPHVFGSVLLREASVVEYQVRQTPTGAEVLVVGGLDDPAAVARSITAGLAGAGVRDPRVDVRVVDSFQRQDTGKVRRFVPVPVAG
jgi:phenylacetate-coenzyme A ligase PaaK-like adenylate-forming protein